MRKLLIVTFLLLLCFFIAGIAVWFLKEPVEPMADVEADIQAIRSITEKWQVAINDGDIDTLMSFYSDNAIKIPPNEPAVIGKEAIRNSYQRHFEENIRQETHVVSDIRVSGDLAFTSTTWSLPEAVDGSGKAKGNWIRIFGKQPDGSWKIAYMMWSDESLIYPT